MFDVAGGKQSLDKLLEGQDGPERWSPALSNKWVQLAQGNDRGVASTDTLDFVSYKTVPPNRKVTYATFPCDH